MLAPEDRETPEDTSSGGTSPEPSWQPMPWSWQEFLEKDVGSIGSSCSTLPREGPDPLVPHPCQLRWLCTGAAGAGQRGWQHSTNQNWRFQRDVPQKEGSAGCSSLSALSPRSYQQSGGLAGFLSCFCLCSGFDLGAGAALSAAALAQHAQQHTRTGGAARLGCTFAQDPLGKLWIQTNFSSPPCVWCSPIFIVHLK